MSHIKWAEIVAFSNVRKLVYNYPQLAGEGGIVHYNCKVKLHGTNAAVQLLADGGLKVQSRTQIITPENDNAGFARWVHGSKDAWLAAKPQDQEVVIFGEFCGPGINKGTAVQNIGKKIFAVFGAQDLNQEDSFIFEPEELSKLVMGIPDVYVLPWHNFTIEVPWTDASEKVKPIADAINAEVDKVERCDPWVKANFGIEGIGEGLVFYPTNRPGREAFSNLGFKAKGEQHKVIASKPAQVDPMQAANAEDFAEKVLPEPRLEQGVRAVAGGELIFDSKNIGLFLAWINKDVEKECQDELAASNLEWKPAAKAVSNKARNWYVARVKAL